MSPYIERLKQYAKRGADALSERLGPPQPVDQDGPAAAPDSPPSVHPEPTAPVNAADAAFHSPTVDDVDADSNIEWNRQRWGQASGWRALDRFGYRWGVNGVEQTVGGVAAFADKHFRPFTRGEYQLDIVELSPGGGRFTNELIRYAACFDHSRRYEPRVH